MGLDLYFLYFSKGGTFYFIVNLFILAISCGVRIFSDYWLAAWPKDEFELSYSTYVWGLWILIGVCTIFIVLRAYTFSHYSSIISLRIFHEFLKNLLKKSMEFFDSTSIG